MARVSTITAAAAALLALGGGAVRAEEAPNGHGVVGGALVGAELTLIGEAIFEVEPAWAYFVGAALGAVAGGYAGSIVEQRAEREASLILLAAGVGLVIPTAVWVGNARQPRPPPAPEHVELLLPRVRVGWGAADPGTSVSVDVLRGRF
jgi:hypothetical protein